MGLSDGGFDRLSGGQGDESKEGSCIFHSGTSSHAGLVQRERRWIMRGWNVSKSSDMQSLSFMLLLLTICIFEIMQIVQSMKAQ